MRCRGAWKRPHPTVRHAWAPEGRDLLRGGHAPQQHEAIPLKLRAHLSARAAKSLPHECYRSIQHSAALL
jgi:hypothetical protein